jgi:hypothetical protein
VANFVAQAIYNLGVRVNCTAAALNGAPLLYQRDFVYTLQVGSGGGPNPPPPGGTGPCQFNFAFDPPVGNLVQVQNTQDPMAWAWTAGFSIVASAQGNCPATSRFTARIAPSASGGFMMQPPLYGPNNIPGRYPTAISVRNSALGPGFATTAIIEICATQSVSQPWRCQNYNYQLRRGGGTSQDIRVSPIAIDFGVVPIGRTETRSLIISNAGSGGNLNYNAATATGPGGSPFFISGSTAGILSPGESATINVAFTPLAAGTFQISLVIRSNDPAQPIVTVPIQGIGSAGGSSPLPPMAPPPATGLQAFIRTDRGCQETGENPIYSVGEQITVSFRVDGVAQALVTIEDIMESGERQIVFQQIVPGNQLLQLTGQIVPPTGRETLRLTAQVGQQSVVSECSFTSQ